MITENENIRGVGNAIKWVCLLPFLLSLPLFFGKRDCLSVFTDCTPEECCRLDQLKYGYNKRNQFNSPNNILEKFEVRCRVVVYRSVIYSILDSFHCWYKVAVVTRVMKVVRLEWRWVDCWSGVVFYFFVYSAWVFV